MTSEELLHELPKGLIKYFDEIKRQLTELGIQDGNIRRYVKVD